MQQSRKDGMMKYIIIHLLVYKLAAEKGYWMSEMLALRNGFIICSAP
jgi:hypothetical protein